MNREDALGKANVIVTGWISDPPKNSRGYVADGWKTPSIAERTEAVEKLARFLMEPDPPAQPVNRLVPPRTVLYGWPVDGMDGPPSLAQYRAALGTRESWLANPDQVHMVAEVSAINLLIEAFEETHPTTSTAPDTP